MKKSSYKNIKPFVPSSFDDRIESISNFEGKEQRALQKKKGHEESLQEAYDKGFKKGYEDGIKQGYEEGLKKAENEITEKIANLNKSIEIFSKAIAEVADFKEQQIKLLMPQIIRLSLTIAEKLVAKKIEFDKEIIIPVLKEALSMVPHEEEKIVVKLNSEDYHLVLREIEKFEAFKDKLQLEASMEIKKGDCLIESRSVTVEAKLEEKLKEIEDALNKLLS